MLLPSCAARQIRFDHGTTATAGSMVGSVWSRISTRWRASNCCTYYPNGSDISSICLRLTPPFRCCSSTCRYPPPTAHIRTDTERRWFCRPRVSILRPSTSGWVPSGRGSLRIETLVAPMDARENYTSFSRIQKAPFNCRVPVTANQSKHLTKSGPKRVSQTTNRRLFYISSQRTRR